MRNVLYCIKVDEVEFDLIPTGEGSPPFEMTVTMVVAKYPEYPPIEDGQGTVRVPSGDITANTRILQRFNGVNQNGKSPESLVHDK